MKRPIHRRVLVSCLAGAGILSMGAVAAHAEVGAGRATSQAASARAHFLEYASAPTAPGVVCLIDSGVDRNPDTRPALVGVEALDPSWGTNDALVDGVTIGPHATGHGTELTALMAAPLNGWGMVGIAPTSVRVYSVRVVPPGLSTTGAGRITDAIYNCVQRRQATEPTMSVINLSLGFDSPGDVDGYAVAFAQAVAYATANGLNVVIAAGNSPQYPLLFPANTGPPAIVVGASDAAPGAGGLCSLSSGGALSIRAPGCNTLTGGLDTAWIDTGTPAVPRNVDGRGTSSSAAIISAVLASLRAYAPSFSPAQAAMCLLQHERRGALDAAAAFDACGERHVVLDGSAVIAARKAHVARRVKHHG